MASSIGLRVFRSELEAFLFASCLEQIDEGSEELVDLHEAACHLLTLIDQEIENRTPEITNEVMNHLEGSYEMS